MITTLTKLGEQLSEDVNEWTDIIDIPKIDLNKENLTAKLVFDLDEQRIYVDIAGQYQEKSPITHKNIKIKDRRGKYTYVCCELSNLAKIEYTFFGKVDTKGKIPSRGEFKERIDNQYPTLKASELYNIFELLFGLRLKFINEKWNDAETINVALFGSDYKKTSNARVALIYACIISTELGYIEPKPIYEIDGFDTYVKLDRLTKSTSSDAKVSYATGLLKQNVTEAEFQKRYSFNYMFVKTTLNYAPLFDKNNFKSNYQVNTDEQLYLERASEYLLKNQQVNIAGINHCIIPQFLNNSEADLKQSLDSVFKRSELLFQSNQYLNLITDLEDKMQDNETYWINFLAFESDGNSFKTINLIEDVSKTHLEKVITTFSDIDIKFKQFGGINWLDMMSELNDKKEKTIYHFNLNTVYRIIPQRKDKEKKNEALSIFKSILEKRQIDIQILFKHFTDLILCHRFKRYEANKNVKRFGEDFFDFAVRDAVFKYLAFFEVLKQLNLISNMENNIENQNVDEVISLEETTSLNDYQNKIDSFFIQMKYKDYQKALFYLGRMLSSVAYIQKDKKKTVLDKLNFNGMDKNDIQRLRNALIEKAKQYNEVDKVIFNDARFGQYFSYNDWKDENGKDVNPNEALFFILTGYSFGIKTKEAK